MWAFHVTGQESTPSASWECTDWLGVLHAPFPLFVRQVPYTLRKLLRCINLRFGVACCQLPSLINTCLFENISSESCWLVWPAWIYLKTYLCILISAQHEKIEIVRFPAISACFISAIFLELVPSHIGTLPPTSALPLPMKNNNSRQAMLSPSIPVGGEKLVIPPCVTHDYECVFRMTGNTGSAIYMSPEMHR